MNKGKTKVPVRNYVNRPCTAGEKTAGSSVRQLPFSLFHEEADLDEG